MDSSYWLQSIYLFFRCTVFQRHQPLFEFEVGGEVISRCEQCGKFKTLQAALSTTQEDK